MKSIKGIKHIAVLTIFVMFISMFSWASASTALTIGSPVITPDFDSNEYVFDINVSGYSEDVNASIILASYDENGTTIDKVIEPLTSAYSKLSLPADKGEKSYKIMLMDTANLKPLCSPIGGELSYGYEVLTLSTDDILSVTNNSVEYFVDPDNSSKTAVISVDAQTIEYNKTDGYYSLTDICYMGETEIKFIDSDGDDVYDIVIATGYIHDIIDYVDAEKDEICFVNNGIVTLDFEDPDKTAVFVDDTGREISLSDFESGDVVAIVCDENRPRRYTYLKVIKLTDSAVNGIVEEMYTRNGSTYLTINGVEYMDYSGYGLSVGDEGTFYIGITGKIIDFKALVKWKYGYVLQGAKNSSGFEDNWEFQLLTIDRGVQAYAVADRGYNYAEAYVVNNSSDLGISDPYSNDAFFGFENKNASARLVKYEIDSNSEIKYIEPATYNDCHFTIEQGMEYNSAKLRLGGYSLNENATVFFVNEYHPKETYVSDVHSLIDESLYTGFTFLDDDSEYSVAVITDVSYKFSERKGLAIATKISAAVDDEGNDVIKVRYMQDEAERILTINDDTQCIGAGGYHELDVGDAFMYVADSADVALAYTLVAKPNYYNSEFEIISANSTLGESTEIVAGYIANTEKKTDSNGEILTVGTGDYGINEENGLFRGNSVRACISNATNAYRYIEAGRNIAVESGDFMTEDEYYARTENGMATVYPVLVRFVDGETRDIYFLDMSKELELNTRFSSVEEEIASIPAYLSLEDKYIVSDARESYEALTDEKKSNITNLDYLINAEKVIAELEWQEANKFSEENGFAVVTRIATSMDCDGNEITKVSCIQNHEEIVLNFNDDSRCSGNVDIRSFDVGDVFLYTADENDFVAHYASVAKVSQSRDEFVITNPDTTLGEETEIITGYIANTKKIISSSGEILTVGTGDYVYGDGEQYLIPKTANKYTYNDAGRMIVIDIGDFMSENVSYAQIYGDTVDVWNVLLRVVDGYVVDIYSLNTPMNIPFTEEY